MCVIETYDEAVEAQLTNGEYQIQKLKSKIEYLESDLLDAQVKAAVFEEMNEDLECRLHRILFMAIDCGSEKEIMQCALQDIVNQASLGLTERWHTRPKGKNKIQTVSRRSPKSLKNKKRANKLVSFKKRYYPNS